MANSDKNITITPNRNLSGFPEVSFVGAGNSAINIEVLDSSVGTLSFQSPTSSPNQIFSIDSNLSSPTNFSVNDFYGYGLTQINSNGIINLSRKTSIGSRGLKLPSFSVNRGSNTNLTYNLPKPEEGLLVYDSSSKTVLVNDGNVWTSYTNNQPVNYGLFFHLDAGVKNSFPGPVNNSVGWRLPSTQFVRGTLLNANRTWSSEPSTGYSSVVLDKTFDAGENFEVIAYWARDYRGIGMIYGPNVSVSDFTGFSADGVGPYFGALNTTGFPSGYSATYFGQYHSPIQGQGAQTTGYWFKWARNSNTLSLQYSATSAKGPWTNIIADVGINNTDRVICGAGEASGTEVSDLDLITVNAGTNTWFDLSGHSHHFTLFGNPNWNSVDGFIFDPDRSSWAECLLRYAYYGGTGNSFTQNVWFKINGQPNGASGATYHNCLIDIDVTGGSQNGLAVAWGVNSPGSAVEGTLVYNTRPSSGGSYTNLVGPVLARHTWYNACVVRDSTNSTKLYLNGILTATYTGDMPAFGTSVIRIGRWTDGTVYSNVSIPIASLYSRALTDAEVRQNFNAYRARFGV